MRVPSKNNYSSLSIVGCTNRIWFGLLKRHGFEVRYLHRVIFGTVVTCLLSPLRIYERWKLGDTIEKTVIHGSPLFIIGHWRSGTTLLHNVLSKDPQFGYVTYEQGLFPHCFLKNKIISRFVKAAMPDTRPMDNMAIDVKSPQEEEQALIALSGHSVYNMWISPHKQLECWKKYCLFDDLEIKNKWSQGYIALLKAATYNFDGKRLLLKNPANTTRLIYLLGKFPDAKFIYIYRNPYTVYESTKNLYRKVARFFNLEDPDIQEEDNNILRIHREMLESYQRDKALIPTDSIIEIKYEEFVNDPESGLKSIYSRLDLGGFDEVSPVIKDYLDSIKGYTPNKFSLDQKSLDAVNDQLGLAFEIYGYKKIVNVDES